LESPSPRQDSLPPNRPVSWYQASAASHCQCCDLQLPISWSIAVIRTSQHGLFESEALHSAAPFTPGACGRGGGRCEAPVPRRLTVAGAGCSLAKGGPRVVCLLCTYGVLLCARLLVCSSESPCCMAHHSFLTAVLGINDARAAGSIICILLFPVADLYC
jgi:hypothetical protein